MVNEMKNVKNEGKMVETESKNKNKDKETGVQTTLKTANATEIKVEEAVDDLIQIDSGVDIEDDIESKIIENIPVVDFKFSIQELEQRVERFKKIHSLIFKITYDQDWIIQEHWKIETQSKLAVAYLTGAGAERIMSAFGISLTNIACKKEPLANGHYYYIYEGVFSFNGQSFTAIGSCNTKKPIFSISRGTIIPPEEINEADIRKSAYTNLLTNGVTKLLGIRGLTEEQLRANGLNPKIIIQYRGKQLQQSQSQSQSQPQTYSQYYKK